MTLCVNVTYLLFQSRDLYLGTLFATEKQKVYGYVTNTRIKFILIVDSSNTTSLRDNEIRQMFRKLHTVYTQLLSNPFYVPGNQGSRRTALTLSGFVILVHYLVSTYVIFILIVLFMSLQYILSVVK